MWAKRDKKDQDHLVDRVLENLSDDEKKRVWRRIRINGIVTKYEIDSLGTCVRIADTKRPICIANSRYLSVSIWIDGKCFHKNVHRLVAETFIPNPENKPQVNHINGIRYDNRVENLEWVTAKENKQHAIRMGLDNPHHGHQVRGIKSGMAKYTEEQVHEVCRLIESGVSSNKKIADIVWVNSSLPDRIRKKEAWCHISDNYTFNNKYEKLRKIHMGSQPDDSI